MKFKDLVKTLTKEEIREVQNQNRSLLSLAYKKGFKITKEQKQEMYRQLLLKRIAAKRQQVKQ